MTTPIDLRNLHFDPVVNLAPTGGRADGQPAARHSFERDQIRAIKAALAASRPLLVRGEPGIGKSQLARAAAKALGRAFVQYVVDARTEARDLLWHFDAVGRLAQAQVIGALQPRLAEPERNERQQCDTEAQIQRAVALLRGRLDLVNFLHPRALWWAFSWQDAQHQATKVGAETPPNPDKGDWQKGCVVLIDEIDKAESDVPNGLLEALGAGSFTPQGRAKPVVCTGPPPLVVITTNEERALPDAFIRRCLVLHLELPAERRQLTNKLMARGCTHFRNAHTGQLDVAPEVLETAANLLADDRAEAERRQWRPLPGQAEYLDLLRAVVNQSGGDLARQQSLIDEVATFVLKKHPDAVRPKADPTDPEPGEPAP